MNWTSCPTWGTNIDHQPQVILPDLWSGAGPPGDAPKVCWRPKKGQVFISGSLNSTRTSNHQVATMNWWPNMLWNQKTMQSNKQTCSRLFILWHDLVHGSERFELVQPRVEGGGTSDHNEGMLTIKQLSTELAGLSSKTCSWSFTKNHRLYSAARDEWQTSASGQRRPAMCPNPGERNSQRHLKWPGDGVSWC